MQEREARTRKYEASERADGSWRGAGGGRTEETEPRKSEVESEGMKCASVLGCWNFEKEK